MMIMKSKKYKISLIKSHKIKNNKIQIKTKINNTNNSINKLIYKMKKYNNLKIKLRMIQKIVILKIKNKII